MINLKKEGGLVGCFLAKTVRRYKDGESGCIMKKIDAMNYLVFDRNLFNSLKAGGIQRVYYCSKDFSIFAVTDGDMLQYINWADFSDVSLAKNSLAEHPLTILYSFCPAEICGLFAAITFFRDVAITIYVSRPQLQGIISYSDFSPGEIADSLKKDCVMLSAAQIEAISDEWSLIIQNQSNLRIFYKNKVVNVQDDYFDTDISCVLPQKGNIVLADILPDIQLSLRRKYGFGLNPRYIEWRVSNIAQCRTTLLQKITGSIVWKYKTTGSYSKTKTISVNYQDDFGIPKYTLTCLKYTGKTFASGTTISADFNIDVDATGEISGGVVSRTVTGIVP